MVAGFSNPKMDRMGSNPKMFAPHRELSAALAGYWHAAAATFPQHSYHDPSKVTRCLPAVLFILGIGRVGKKVMALLLCSHQLSSISGTDFLFSCQPKERKTTTKTTQIKQENISSKHSWNIAIWIEQKCIYCVVGMICTRKKHEPILTCMTGCIQLSDSGSLSS